jgi:hypothetical protein
MLFLSIRIIMYTRQEIIDGFNFVVRPSLPFHRFKLIFADARDHACVCIMLSTIIIALLYT